MNTRYIKNLPNLITEEQQEQLLTKHIGVIGCGGNGGYVIEFLARLGIKELSFWDGDIFEESNLNRQIFCFEDTIGYNKAEIAEQYVKKINSNIICNSYHHYFGNIEDLLNAAKCDIIIICSDTGHNWENNRIIFHELLLRNIPIVDEAINSTCVWIKIFTKDNINEFDEDTRIRKQWVNNETNISQPSYICSLAASITLIETVKYLTGQFSQALNGCIEFEINNMKIHRSIHNRRIY